MPTTQDQDRASRIELILRQVDTLPTLSPIATRLLEIAGAEDADLDRIVEIIETDPAMTARLLGLCRRADKGLGDRITTVRRAVVMLGLEAVQAAALSVAVYDLMEQWAQSAEDRATINTFGSAPFEREGFWRYSVSVACAAELIADAHPELQVQPEEAFVAGLLHGLGKLILDLILPRSYARVIGLAERRQSSSSEIELNLLGVDHHTAGKRLAEHWGLPYALQDTIWLCGQPASSIPDLPHKSLISVVTVARALVRHLHLGWSGDFAHPEPLDGPRGLCPAHGLDAARAESCVPRLHEEVLRRCKVLGLSDQSSAAMLLQSVAAANRKLGRISSMFEIRARAAQRQARILTSISSFHAAWRPGRGTVDTLGEVARSAAAYFGPGFFATVHQPREGEPWQMCQFGPDGSLIRACGVEPPTPGVAGRCASLSALCAGGDLNVGAISLLPWLTDYILDSADVRKLRILPLCLDENDPAAAGPSVILIHDALIHAGERPLLAPLASTWAAAIIAAAQHEGSRRLGERLASANRTLSETQTRLAESESLARLGEMAAGAAHEMNNPLTIISGRAQLLASTITEAADRAAAESIARAARDLSDLITSLRLVADPPRPILAPTDLTDLARAALDLTQARTHNDTDPADRIAIHIPPSIPPVPMDSALIAAAVSELLANALQACPGAPIDFRAQIAPSDSRLEMSITDHGPGMSTRALQHAFDPFFSEKPAGRRTGLGLTRARALVQLHGGDIHLESRPGQGTTATIRLPLTTEAQSTAA